MRRLLPLILVAVFVSCGNAPSADQSDGNRAAENQTEHEAANENGLPQTLLDYTVVDKHIGSTPGATKVFLDIVLSGAISRSALRTTLRTLYRDTKQRTGFKWHEHPTNIRIYAYPSRAHYEGAGSSWVAGITSTPSTVGEPEVEINERVLAGETSKPTERLGLSEEKRRRIFHAIVDAEDRAKAKARDKYPTSTSAYSMDELDDVDWLEVGRKQNALYESLAKRYKAEIAEKYGLSMEQLDKINREALREGWPLE